MFEGGNPIVDRVEFLKSAYNLEKHPEGGAFAEAYTAPFQTPDGRALMGSIYFLLEGGDVSHFHRIDCDELWYYHEGCGMRVTMIDAEGAVAHADLGPDPAAGQRAMVAIPAGAIFAAENLDAGGYSFVSCATAPQFQYEGFLLIGSDTLRRLCPERAEALLRLAYPGRDRRADG